MQVFITIKDPDTNNFSYRSIELNEDNLDIDYNELINELLIEVKK